MSNRSKQSDDYVGALLREEALPNEVVNSLLRLRQCNVDGLRRHVGSSQRRCADKLTVDFEALDGFPHKVKTVLGKMDVTLMPEHAEQLDNACATWTNTGEPRGCEGQY